jgi:hypothetical protein
MTGNESTLSGLLVFGGLALVLGAYMAAIYGRRLIAWLLVLGAAGLLIYWGWGLH